MALAPLSRYYGSVEPLAVRSKDSCRSLWRAAVLACAATLAACASAPHPGEAPLEAAAPDSGDAGGVPAFVPGPPPPVLFTLFKPGAKPSSNWLALNEYFPVHYWYEDILYRFGLHLRLSLEDKILILGGLLFNLDFEEPVLFVVDDYIGPQALVVRVQLVEARPGTAVLLEANVDPDSRRAIPEDKRLFHGYRRLYLLSRSELVSLRDLRGLAGGKPVGGPEDPAELADRYIFDGDPANDTTAERLLLLACANSHDAARRLRSRLSLAQLYASRALFDRAELALASARLLLEQELADRQDLREAFWMVAEELLITRALRALGSRPLELGIPAL